MKTDIELLEEQVAANRAAVERMDALNALRKNTHFKRIILNGYMGDEAIRATSMLASPVTTDVARCQSQLMGISWLHEFFRVIDLQGEQAQAAINAAQETIQEINEAE